MILPIPLVGAPAIMLVVGTVLSLHEERRRGNPLQVRLVQKVAAAYAMPEAWGQ